MNASLTLTHAAEYMQSTTFSFSNLTPENKGRQEAAALLRRKAREVERVETAQREWDSSAHMIANTLKELLDDGPPFFLSRDDMHQLHALIGVRDRKQEAFLRAVAGAPE